MRTIKTRTIKDYKAFKDLEWTVRINEQNHQTQNSGPKYVKTYMWHAFAYVGDGDEFDAHISGIMELRSPRFSESVNGCIKDWEMIAELNEITMCKIEYENFNAEDIENEA